MVDSYFAEGQYPSGGLHPCYGYTPNPTETGLCLYSNEVSANSNIDNSYSCSEITVGGLGNSGKINYCDYDTIFGSRLSERKNEYEFRFIPLPEWSKCGSQEGDSVPLEFNGINYSRDSINLKRIVVHDTVKAQGKIKLPLHRNSGKILNITKNKIDNTKVLQITEGIDSKKRVLKRIKTRQGNP